MQLYDAERNETGQCGIWLLSSAPNCCLLAVRLRQVPPVIADRVTDPTRHALRGASEKKWYHGLSARLLYNIEGELFLRELAITKSNQTRRVKNG